VLPPEEAASQVIARLREAGIIDVLHGRLRFDLGHLACGGGRTAARRCCSSRTSASVHPVFAAMISTRLWCGVARQDHLVDALPDRIRFAVFNREDCSAQIEAAAFLAASAC